MLIATRWGAKKHPERGQKAQMSRSLIIPRSNVGMGRAVNLGLKSGTGKPGSGKTVLNESRVLKDL